MKTTSSTKIGQQWFLVRNLVSNWNTFFSTCRVTPNFIAITHWSNSWTLLLGNKKDGLMVRNLQEFFQICFFSKSLRRRWQVAACALLGVSLPRAGSASPQRLARVWGLQSRCPERGNGITLLLPQYFRFSFSPPVRWGRGMFLVSFLTRGP